MPVPQAHPFTQARRVRRTDSSFPALVSRPVVFAAFTVVISGLIGASILRLPASIPDQSALPSVAAAVPAINAQPSAPTQHLDAPLPSSYVVEEGDTLFDI